MFRNQGFRVEDSGFRVLGGVPSNHVSKPAKHDGIGRRETVEGSGFEV